MKSESQANLGSGSGLFLFCYPFVPILGIVGEEGKGTIHGKREYLN